MRLLADENVPHPSILHLRQAGLDVGSVREETAGISDREVLAKARAEDRLLLTFDHDFGELVYRRREPPPRGIILFRLIPGSPREAGSLLLAILSDGTVTLDGFFSVVERDHVRQRPLPVAGAD